MTARLSKKGQCMLSDAVQTAALFEIAMTSSYAFHGEVSLDFSLIVTLAHRIVCRCLVLQDGHQRHCQHDQQSYLRQRLHQPHHSRSAHRQLAAGNPDSSGCFASTGLQAGPCKLQTTQAAGAQAASPGACLAPPAASRWQWSLLPRSPLSACGPPGAAPLSRQTA